MINLPLSDETIQSLSRHELDVLKYVYEHTESVLDLSIRELSERVSYSPATVLRFCKKLGYSGFAEFKYALRAARRESGGQEAAPSTRPARSSDLMIDLLSANMQATAGLIQEEQLLRTFRFFDSPMPIYIWSPGGITDTTGEYLERLLLSTGRQSVYRIESARLFSHLINTVGKDSLMVLISTSGTFGNTIRIGKLAQMKGLPILSITPYTSNEIADLSTVSFRFFTDQRENLGAEYTSRLPIFFTIHTIIQCYIRYREERESRQEGGSHDSTV